MKRDQLLTVVAHPVSMLVLRTALAAAGPVSPKALAEHVRLPLENTSYHVRKLRDAELLEHDGDVHVRGAVMHLYRPTAAAHELVNRVDGIVGTRDGQTPVGDDGNPPERLAVCQHPNGEGLYVPLKPGEAAPTTCFQDCDCTPAIYVREDRVRARTSQAREAQDLGGNSDNLQ